MKARKTKDLKRVLIKEGFMADLAKNHHSFFCLMIDGKKHSIKTYFSHSLNEYGPQLMGQMKKQKKIFRHAHG